MPARFAAVLALLLCACQAIAAEAGHYGNARFGYALEIPAGFSAIVEADNSDGGTSRSAEGKVELAVWGSNLDGAFAADIRSRAASDAQDGWSVSYSSIKPARASWSGSKGDRIVYAHGVAVCRGQAAYFRLEYDRAAAKAFDPVVARLVKTLKGAGRCM